MKSPSFVRNMKKCELRKARYSKGKGKKKTEKGKNIKDRTPGSTSLVPPCAGVMCASYVVNDILKEV